MLNGSEASIRQQVADLHVAIRSFAIAQDDNCCYLINPSVYFLYHTSWVERKVNS
jgi:hypothetical protein